MKKLCLKKICTVALVLLLCFSCYFTINTVCQNNYLKDNLYALANEENPNVEIEKTGEILYRALLFARDNIYYEDITEATPLKQNDFLDNECLNLSEMDIENITGIMYFNLDNLKELYLQKNKIKNILSLSFYNLSSLDILDLSDNEIENIDFGNLKRIQSLYLQNNKLSSLNLYNIKNVNDSEGYINLENNNFSSIIKLNLPTEGTKYIDLYGNNIADASIEQGAYYPHKLNFIIQDLYDGIEIDDKTQFRIFPSYSGHNFKLKFTNRQTYESQFIEYGSTDTLVVGSFKVEIYDNDTNLSEINVYPSFDIFVTKGAPTVNAYMNGKLIEPNTKIDSPVTLKFQIEEGYAIYYNINGEGYKEGSEVTLEKNGTYSILVKAQKGDITSKVLSVEVDVQIQENIFWKALIFMLIVAAFSIMFIVLKSWLNDK